jgi:hypothetical protein
LEVKPHYIFQTEAEAVEAERQISALMGLPVDCVNIASGKSDSTVRTLRWAEPVRAVDGWVIPIPDDPDHFIEADTVENPTFGETR